MRKIEVSGLIILFIGVALLIFTFLNAYWFLTQDIGLIATSDLVKAFGEALAPLIATCIRIMYLGIMGWVGSLLTLRGISLLKQEAAPQIKVEKKSQQKQMTTPPVKKTEEKEKVQRTETPEKSTPKETEIKPETSQSPSQESSAPTSTEQTKLVEEKREEESAETTTPQQESFNPNP